MKPSFYLCFALILLCGVFSAVVSSADEDAVNPAYQDWSQFKSGSFVTYKASTEAAGITTESEITYTLKEVTEEKVVVEIKTVTVMAGMKVEQPGEIVEFLAEGEGEEMGIVISEDMSINVSDAEASTKVDEGIEEIEIKGTKLKAQRIKVQTEADTDTDVTATIWYSDEVPGRMVKSVSEVKDVVPVKAEMVVVDYKAIK